MRDASVFVWRGEGTVSNTQLWTRIFSKTKDKILRFQKYPDTSWRGLKRRSHSFRLKNIYQKCDAKQFSLFLLIKPFPFLSFSSPSSSSWLLELAGSVTTETCECTILDMRRRISLKKRLFDGKRASKTTSAGTH